jgi:hypothetical protein
VQIQGLPSNILPAPAASGGAGLRAGQTLQSVVQGTADQPFLSLGGARVPLEPALGLTPGQAVQVEVQDNAGQLQLNVTPQAAPGAAAPMDAVGALVRQALEILGSAPRSEATALLPSLLPQNADAVRQLLSLFVSRGSLGRDLDALAGWLHGAADAGSEGAAQALAWLSSFSETESAALANVLRQLSEGRSFEARLAAALGAGDDAEGAFDSVQADLRAWLGGLQDDKTLMAWLRGQGQTRDFDSVVQRVLDRLGGAQLQNLHGVEQPYVFLEVPFPPGNGLEHAQVHFLSEDGRSKGRFDPGQATVAIDLATTRLGDLWITLHAAGGHCRCDFRATQPDAVQAITDASGELVEALNGAGYTDAVVRASLWDGDRLRAAAALVRPWSGLNVSA